MIEDILEILVFGYIKELQLLTLVVIGTCKIGFDSCTCSPFNILLSGCHFELALCATEMGCKMCFIIYTSSIVYSASSMGMDTLFLFKYRAPRWSSYWVVV